ncbi:hypothetical protein AVEN_207393-1, partial [Araneus ventricosus]
DAKTILLLIVWSYYERFNVQEAHIEGGISVESGFEPEVRWPRSRDNTIMTMDGCQDYSFTHRLVPLQFPKKKIIGYRKKTKGYILCCAPVSITQKQTFDDGLYQQISRYGRCGAVGCSVFAPSELKCWSVPSETSPGR